MQVKDYIEKLNKTHDLTKEEWIQVLDHYTEEDAAYAAELARSIKEEHYGNKIFLRGLIEYTNICKNDCYYCGIRRGNVNADRYRLTLEQIMDCCAQGYELGYRTFVLQGGEDPYFDDDKMVDIILKIKSDYPDCALTLSIGEKEEESYRRFKEAGADRYLLRHETADEEHYRELHPQSMSLEHRKNCLCTLMKLGYQVGTGFMVGSPGQTSRTLAEDMIFIKELNPQMVGIGPFIPHHDTCFANETAGSMEQTLFLLSLIRIMLPKVLLPATTALGTIHPLGREKGVQAGANVVMPNLSPTATREKYELYDNKICTGDEAAHCRSCLERRMESIGSKIATGRGDYLG